MGIVLADGRGSVLWAQRVRKSGWQFPQGGIQKGEKPEQALYRALHEEVGLQPDDVELIASTRGWLRYRLPNRFIRPTEGQRCIGQKQKWFLLMLRASEDAVKLDLSDSPEFESWRWVSYWYPVNQVVEFKRNVYQRMLKELSAPHSQMIANLSRSRSRQCP